MDWLNRYLVPTLRHVVLVSSVPILMAADAIQPVVVEKGATSYQQVSYRVGKQTITQNIRLDTLEFWADDLDAAEAAVEAYGSVAEVAANRYKLTIDAVEPSPTVLQQAYQALLATDGVSGISRAAERESEPSIGGSAVIALDLGDGAQDINALATLHSFKCGQRGHTF